MPSVFTHIAVPLAIGLGLGKKSIPIPLLAAGLLGSVIPDLDVIGLQHGIAYADQFGHRGFTHSIAFAISLGVLAFIFSKVLRTNRLLAFLFVCACTLSHPLLDAMSNGGHGVALFWPIDNARYFFSWRPIEVAHIGLRFFK
ncbi:MAG: metal-dependent hydrolase, partial [Arenimonas sp.]